MFDMYLIETLALRKKGELLTDRHASYYTALPRRKDLSKVWFRRHAEVPGLRPKISLTSYQARAN